MTSPTPVPLGQYRGFDMDLSFESMFQQFKVTVKGALCYTITLGTDVLATSPPGQSAGKHGGADKSPAGNSWKIPGCSSKTPNWRWISPFPRKDELKRKSARLDELNILLNMDKRESEIVDGDVGDEVTAPARGSPDRER